jgi:predicted deacetylase
MSETTQARAYVGQIGLVLAGALAGIIPSLFVTYWQVSLQTHQLLLNRQLTVIQDLEKTMDNLVVESLIAERDLAAKSDELCSVVPGFTSRPATTSSVREIRPKFSEVLRTQEMLHQTMARRASNTMLSLPSLTHYLSCT